VDTGVAPAYLALERERAFRFETTTACEPEICRACGACSQTPHP
jgi:hypothetical protein